MSRIPDHDRLHDLLAAHATVGLTPAEERELSALMRDAPAGEAASLDAAAAALHVALAADAAREPLPTTLRERLLRSADAAARTPDVAGRIGPTAAPGRSTRFLGGAGWLVAAACLVLAVTGWWPRMTSPAKLAPAAELDLFLRTVADAVRLPWADFNAIDTGAPPEVRGVQGEVVWSDTAQRGYMRLAGLPPNNPTREQYQLWIVDAERGLTQRISGAVFSVGPGGEAVVPVRPEYPVGKAALFAITIERPGGVVVSDMSRRACMAARGG